MNTIKNVFLKKPGVDAYINIYPLKKNGGSGFAEAKTFYIAAA